ncbi:MAG: YraN family protein [Candidatus Dormibacteria bacterium]
MEGQTRAALGKAGEQAAARFLERRGLVMVEADVRLPSGQVDLVMRDADCLVIVEVKSRRTATYGLPQDAVTAAKLRRLRRLAGEYLALRRPAAESVRIDVVAVDLGLDGAPGRCFQVKAVG